MIRVYLDNCCFNRPYDEQHHLKVRLETQAKLSIQQMIIDNDLELVVSYVLEQENDDNPYAERKMVIDDFFKYAVLDIDETQEIIDIAEEAMQSGLKVNDSLHFACAVAGKCDYLLTTDKRFLKHTTDKVHIMNPAQFIIETEG